MVDGKRGFCNCALEGLLGIANGVMVRQAFGCYAFDKTLQFGGFIIKSTLRCELVLFSRMARCIQR